ELVRMSNSAEDSRVKEIRISEQKDFDGLVFPLVLSPNPEAGDKIKTAEDACNWLKSQSGSLQEKLLKHGAVFFRGFPLNDAQDFDKFVTSYGIDPLPYVGGAAVRNQITSKVFTANEAPPDQPIPFHHEMAQVPTYPSILFFFCDVAPPSGGQTPIVLSNLVYKAMLEKYPQFIADLEQKKIQYTRILPEEDDPSSPIGRGWKSTFLTNEKTEAEKKCLEQGTSFEWLPNGCLKTVTAVLPAIKEDIRTGKKVWFNSIIAAYLGWRDSRNPPGKAVTFSDGTPMPDAIMEDLEKILDQLAVDVTWEKGDVMLVDNNQALHARRTFTPPRRILASLGK
ncbi:clavaminate synthase-like protein, partial [Biomphalaria glabrata]